MTARVLRSSFAVALCLLLPAASRGQELLVAPDQPQGIYQPSQTIRWNLQLKGANASEASYVIKKGGLTEMSRGKAPLTDGKGFIEAKLDQPG